jgi:hypothetical protein
MNQSFPVSGRTQLRERDFTRRIQGTNSAKVFSELVIVICVDVISRREQIQYQSKFTSLEFMYPFLVSENINNENYWSSQM